MNKELISGKRIKDMLVRKTLPTVLAGSMIFGIMGIFISFPVAIILVTTYKYYWNSISDSIKEIKETSKQEKNA